MRHLKAMRKCRGITASAMADLCGIRFMRYTLIEIGFQKPTLSETTAIYTTLTKYPVIRAYEPKRWGH